MCGEINSCMAIVSQNSGFSWSALGDTDPCMLQTLRYSSFLAIPPCFVVFFFVCPILPWFPSLFCYEC